MNYAIGKQKCPTCGRFRVLEHPADPSINVGAAWWCKHCQPGRAPTPAEKVYYEELDSNTKLTRID